MSSISRSSSLLLIGAAWPSVSGFNGGLMFRAAAGWWLFGGGVLVNSLRDTVEVSHHNTVTVAECISELWSLSATVHQILIIIRSCWNGDAVLKPPGLSAWWSLCLSSDKLNPTFNKPRWSSCSPFGFSLFSHLTFVSKPSQKEIHLKSAKKAELFV